MHLNEYELEQEKKHLNETIEIIKEIIEEKNININSYKKTITENKKFIWQNQNDFKAPELYNTMDEEDFSVNLINKDIQKVYRLYRSLENPFFTRIDFKDENDTNTFYIGLTSVIKNHEPVIYDWRANIANLYYNYGVGPSSYPTPEGVVNGTTTLKRNFEFELGKLTNVYNSDSAINDSILETVLKNNTSDMMTNIVGTIQKEQNEIIRHPNAPLIVEGVAGSGKTSVALHRIAYLLYNQKNLNYKNVLIFSPSEVFSHYISNVLPELGEENVATSTFHDFASFYIKNAKIETLVEFIERYYEKCEHNDFNNIKYKMSTSYKKEIDVYLTNLFDSLKFTKKIGLKTKFLTSNELNAIKHDIPKNLNFHNKMLYLCEKICRNFQIDEDTNAPKFYDILLRLFKIDKNPLKLYQNFTKANLDDFIHYEDLCGILYLYFEIHGYPELNEVKFVCIDEAQDYSKWQFMLIKSIFNAAKFTILGDNNQSINPYLKYNSLEEIKPLFNNCEYKKLGYTYRSSKEIITYANKVLGLDNENIIRGEFGLPVIELIENNLKKDIENILETFYKFNLKKIAIITKTKKECDLIKSLNFKNVLILPVYISKGLEYDGVIIYTEKNNSFKEDEKSLFYVGITRALHGLAIINQKK